MKQLNFWKKKNNTSTANSSYLHVYELQQQKILPVWQSLASLF